MSAQYDSNQIKKQYDVHKRQSINIIFNILQQSYLWIYHVEMVMLKPAPSVLFDRNCS